MKDECWKKSITRTTRIPYYINLETGESQWGEPTGLKDWEKHTSNNQEPGKTYYRYLPSLFTQWDSPLEITDTNILPEHWEERKSKCGNVYYVNNKEKISVWKRPSFEPNNIILFDRILEGASDYPVWNGTLSGKPVIYKLMSTYEYNWLIKAQGIGVVRLLYKTENYKLPKKMYQEDGVDKKGILVAMEKLNTIKLHPYYTEGFSLDTEKKFRQRVLYMHSLHSFESNILRKLLNTIVEINNKGISWGDLKQENFGLDKDGQLRIFDFTESCTISPMEKIPYTSKDKHSIGKYYIKQSNKHFDILAYGKLLYNIITQTFSFYPGGHYKNEDGLIREQYLQVIDMIQDIDSISKNALQKCFLLDGKSENLDNDLSEAIKALYLMLNDVPDVTGVPEFVD
jgi:hypothetical protein